MIEIIISNFESKVIKFDFLIFENNFVDDSSTKKKMKIQLTKKKRKKKTLLQMTTMLNFEI